MGYNKKFSKKTIGGKTSAGSSTTSTASSPLNFIYNRGFWLQMVILLILLHICQRFKFFNYRNIYYLYGIVLLFVVNVVNSNDESSPSPVSSSQGDTYSKNIKTRDKNYKNEPYKINYTNPFITNLDNINFNFRAQYNLGDFKTYLFNKIDELLISKYVSFYKVLSFNKNNLGTPLIISKQFDINDNHTNIFMGLANTSTITDGTSTTPGVQVTKVSNTIDKQIDNSDIYLKTKALVLMRGNVLQIPALGVDNNLKPIITSRDSLDNRELYIQIYERNDLNKYEPKDNLTVIKDNVNMKDRCTLIDTNLDARVQYVAHISYMNTNKHPIGQTNEAYGDYLKEIEKQTHDAVWDDSGTSTPYKDAFEKNTSNMNTDGTITAKIITNGVPFDISNTSKLDDIKKFKNALINMYNTANQKEKIAILAKIRYIDFYYYKNKDPTDQTIYPYFPSVQTNKYYPIDHAMYVNKQIRYIPESYPYLLIPVILIDKPNVNINKPLFYENTKDVQKNRQQRNWLVKEYNKIIETQFKGFIFDINSFYRKYTSELKQLDYNPVSDEIVNKKNSQTTMDDILFIKSNKRDIKSGANNDLFYQRIKNNQNDISFNTYNDLNKSKNKINQWGFKITIENIISAVDKTNKELNRDTMPYLIIEYGKIIEDEEATSGNKLKLDDDTISYTIINLSITNDKKLFYDKHKESPFLYNKISDEAFNKTNEITLDKEEYIDKINKIKEELLLSEKPDKYILKDINTKLKQYNSPYSNNKIFISENFVNTEFLYDYKIKMNMIVSKILDHYFRANLLSIQEWSFNFSKASLIKFDNLLRYGNNKKLILKNIPITNYNITKHFKDIYELRIHYRHFLLNIYKELWFITETSSKPESYTSEYVIESNNKYYYFDSSEARKYDLNFHKNIENIINKTPIISGGKQIGIIKHFVKHIGIEENLVVQKDLEKNDIKFSKERIKNIKTGDNISYQPTYKNSGTLAKGDLFLIHRRSAKNIKTDRQESKILIRNYIKNDMEKHIKMVNNNILININENIEIAKNDKIGYKDGQDVDITIDIKQNTMPELYGRNFIYISEDSIKTNSETYDYPNFIKIGKNIESINIGKMEDGYELPDIRLLESECSTTINNNINNETNIFPVINAYSLDNEIDDAVDRLGTETFNKQKLILLELPLNISWGESSRSTENEIIFNNLDDKIKNKYYQIFDYSHQFVHNNLLDENLVIEEIICDPSTPTRFKIKISSTSRSLTDPILELLFKSIKNAKIYEKYVTFHNINYVGNDIEYSSAIEYLLYKSPNCLIKQNSMYKIYDICKNKAIGENLNDYIIEFETYYNVCTEDAYGTDKANKKIFRIQNIQQDYSLAIKKYTNIDKKSRIINRDVNNYSINENICQYIDNVNQCFEYYKVESTKSESNMNKNIWNMNNFYYGKNLIDFSVNDITNANSDSKKNTYMTKLIDNIIFNEVSKIHYNIPKKIGIKVNTDTSIDTYNYGSDLFIPYYKRNQPVSNININTDTNICIDYGSSINSNVVTIDRLAIYNTAIGTYKQYYYYYKNIFINILGLYDDINAECNNFIKLGKSILNQDKTLNQSTKLTSLKKYIKIPLNLNKYLTFSDNYMLFIRKTKKILEDNNTSLTNEMLGLPIIVNNRYFDSTYLSKFSSNTENTKKCKRFLQRFIKQFKIGMSGFTSDIAEEICSRIYTVYDKDCDKTYPTYRDKEGKFSIETYNHNKNRDKCFNTIFNDVEYTEMKQLKEKGKWLFKESCEDQDNAYFGTDPRPNLTIKKKYYKAEECYTKNDFDNMDEDVKNFLDKVNLSQHRIATVKDIEGHMNRKNGISVDSYGLVKDENLPDISNLVKPTITETTIDDKKITKYDLEYINKSDINKYNNKGLFCYGRKPDNSKLSKEGDAAVYYFNQKKIKQNIKDIKKYENIEYFNVPEENYSAWN